MVTSGLNIVIFGGRYFTYYHRSDAYPERLGKDIVNTIPKEAEKYKSWLGRQRAHYARITTRLETQVLSVTADKMEDVIDSEITDTDEDGENEDIFYDGPAWKSVDYDLNQLPMALFDPGDSRWVDWTYLVDLDRELFCVNHWIFFNLWNVPRDRWIQALGCNEGHDVFDFELCPEALTSTIPPAYFPRESSEHGTYHNIYHGYHASICKFVATHSQAWQRSAQQIMAIAMFDMFTNAIELSIWDHLSGYHHRSFAFRELAFAVLSLAAGKFTFEMPDRLYGQSKVGRTEGYLIDIDKDGQLVLMPLFGSGCHLPDQEPGSSPCDSLYCIGEVVVSLVPDSVFGEDTEAAIAKTVAYGLGMGKTAFPAILFSIYNAVLIDVCTQNEVVLMRCTRMFPVYVNRWENPAKDTFTETVKAMVVLDQIYLAHPGFATLQRFFNTTVLRRIPACDQGVFPPEVYAGIIAHVDTSTREACAQVSRTFYELCLDHFSFSKDITITKFEPHHLCAETSLIRSSFDWSGLGTFTFLNHRTGLLMQSSLDVSRQIRIKDEKQVTTWCPVIGENHRLSIVTNIQLRLLLRRKLVKV